MPRGKPPAWWPSSRPGVPAGYRLRVCDLPPEVTPDSLRGMFGTKVENGLHPNAIAITGGAPSGAGQAWIMCVSSFVCV
eukprot:11901236-Karenia_brevis.AAC.1